VAARVVDWGLAALVAALAATGGLTLFAGASSDAWVFAAHDALGLAICLLLAFKLRRVWPRLTPVGRWDRRTSASVGALALVLTALASGVAWAAGVTPSPAGFSVLAWHEALGAALVIAVATHMALRAKPLRSADIAQRRQFLITAGIAAGSFAAWRVQRPLETVLRLTSAKRRFTGSYERDSFAGNAFPTTSWVADHPRQIDPTSYRLRVEGLVARRLELKLAELAGIDELIATLDCTGGFYSTQHWRGIRLGRLLDEAGVAPHARHVSIASRTGYRWSFALSDARGLLLATHVGGEALSHEHGAPLRLIVPDARGYQWVKWVERVEVRADPDYGAPASTVWSSLTAAGTGRT